MRSKKAVINIISSFILQIAMIVCNFVVPSMIIKKFGSNVNGLVSSITQFLAYITLLESGFGPVVKATLYKPIAKNDKKQIQNILRASEKFFKVISGIFLIYLIVLSFVYPLIVNTEFSFAYTMSLVLIISISTIAEYYFGMTYRLFLQAEQKTYFTSIVQIISYVLNTIAIVILIKYNCSIHIVKLVSGFIFVLRPVAQNIYVKKKYNINLKEADKKYKLKQKWDGLAQHIASVVHNNTDIVILTIFMPIAEVSVYSVYCIVVKGVKSIIQSFTGGVDASFGDMIAKGEKEILNKSFKTYELFYYTIITIVYVCTTILIAPFITVYTLGVTDADYIRTAFGGLLVLGEFVWAIRLPYSSITLAAGHFKETRKGAWIEAISNVVISLVLVWKFGIVGVTIGTLFAMIIRTVEFMYHTNKDILKRKQIDSIKRVVIITVETFLILVISTFIPKIEMISYFAWIKYAMIIFIISIIIVLPINIIFYKNDTKELLNTAKRVLIRNKD